MDTTPNTNTRTYRCRVDDAGMMRDLLGHVSYGLAGTVCSGNRNGAPCALGQDHSGYCVAGVALAVEESAGEFLPTPAGIDRYKKATDHEPRTPLDAIVETLVEDYRSYWDEESFEYLCGRRGTQPLTFAEWFESDVECDQELANEARTLGWSPAELSIGGPL